MTFEITPKGVLTSREHAFLDEFFPLRSTNEPCYRIEIVDRDIDIARVQPPPPYGAPANVSWDRKNIIVDHDVFTAVSAPHDRVTRLHRRRDDAFGLQAALRTSVTAALPLHDGVLLHAAAVSRNDVGIVFFGQSGAGKSTIAAHADCDVLSDELVAISPDGNGGYVASATGFWGALENKEAYRKPVSIKALVELEKGDFSVAALSHADAMRGLVRTAMFYPVEEVAPRAIAVVTRIASSVDVLRMRWHPQRNSWSEIESAFA